MGLDNFESGSGMTYSFRVEAHKDIAGFVVIRSKQFRCQNDDNPYEHVAFGRGELTLPVATPSRTRRSPRNDRNRRRRWGPEHQK